MSTHLALQVRLIVERLVRRLDYESVADCMPEDDRKLLVHIRKEQARKQRKKGEAEEGTMVRSAITRYHSQFFPCLIIPCLHVQGPKIIPCLLRTEF